jgi:plastocyanin
MVKSGILRAWLCLAVVTVALVAGACGEETAQLTVLGPDETGSGSTVDGAGEEYDFDYVVPFGTGRRVKGGEKVEIVPRTLEAKVGQRIRIVNEDSQGVAVGIFWVPAGRTVAMEFTSPGVLEGECDIHPSGKFTIEVT